VSVRGGTSGPRFLPGPHLLPSCLLPLDTKRVIDVQQIGPSQELVGVVAQEMHERAMLGFRASKDGPVLCLRRHGRATAEFVGDECTSAIGACCYAALRW
jgi:hypothetical protein